MEREFKIGDIVRILDDLGVCHCWSGCRCLEEGYRNFLLTKDKLGTIEKIDTDDSEYGVIFDSRTFYKKNSSSYLNECFPSCSIIFFKKNHLKLFQSVEDIEKEKEEEEEEEEARNRFNLNRFFRIKEEYENMKVEYEEYLKNKGELNGK